jgi:hypothetical protein
MGEIKIFQRTGRYAENKDIARDIRLEELLPALDKGEEVILNFNKVDVATQSFIHALISDAIRQHEKVALDRLAFKACNESIQRIISIVVDYMQEALKEKNK